MTKYPTNFVQDKWKLRGNRIWRHVAVQYDETNNYYRIFYDGELAHEADYGNTITGIDCSGSTGLDERLNFGYE